MVGYKDWPDKILYAIWAMSGQERDNQKEKVMKFTCANQFYPEAKTPSCKL